MRAIQRCLQLTLLIGFYLSHPLQAHESATSERLQALLAPNTASPGNPPHLPAVLLLGEQHDAAEHQQIQREVVQWLAQRQLLAALVMEMVEAGRSTAGLPSNASASQIRDALAWRDAAWPWVHYGPVVMAAVAAGVPVSGGNLPLTQMRDAMQSQPLDSALPGPALKAQQQAIRLGHCGLLPEPQIAPMTRIQIARDQRMAQVLQGAVQPGKVALLVAGAGHVDRQLGVPQHLAADLKTAVVIAQSRPEPNTAATSPAATPHPRADAIWLTPALPEKDYCTDLQSPRLAPSTPQN